MHLSLSLEYPTASLVIPMHVQPMGSNAIAACSPRHPLGVAEIPPMLGPRAATVHVYTHSHLAYGKEIARPVCVCKKQFKRRMSVHF